MTLKEVTELFLVYIWYIWVVGQILILAESFLYILILAESDPN